MRKKHGEHNYVRERIPVNNHKPKTPVKTPISTEKAIENFHVKLVSESWFHWLQGENFIEKPQEILFSCESEESLKPYISTFEKKFNKKLKYHILNDIVHISYQETELINS